MIIDKLDFCSENVIIIIPLLVFSHQQAVKTKILQRNTKIEIVCERTVNGSE